MLLNLLILGTGPFAVPMFRRLLDSHHHVEGLITRPARAGNTHGRKTVDVNPMRAVAEDKGLPVHAPESINTDAARAEMAQYSPDLLVVCDFGQILSPASLAVARLGGINLHASLLPKYRGAAPIHWAIYHGDAATGVTVIHMTPQLDGGPCLAQQATPIGPDETQAELEVRLSEIGAELVLQTIGALAENRAMSILQNQSLASKAPRLKKTDGQIDWSRSAIEIRNQIRAFQPWPASFTNWWRPEGDPVRLILDRATIVSRGTFETLALPVAPGTVLEASHGRLVVATGKDDLSLERIQPSGKRLLTAHEFLNGYPVKVQQVFG